MPSPEFFLIFDLKMVSFGAFWVVFYVIWSYKKVNKEIQYRPGKAKGAGSPPGPTLSPAWPPSTNSVATQGIAHPHLIATITLMLHDPDYHQN